MKIKIDPLDRDSIDNAIAQINNYRKSLNGKIEEVLDILSQIGKEVVETQFSIVSEYETFEVYCEVEGNSAMIIAEGENVVFLEFGTGVDTDDNTNEMETEGLPPIYKGSWSETEGRGTFARHGYWHYNGVLYEGTMATHGFYFASKEIKERAVEEAKKVFRK